MRNQIVTPENKFRMRGPVVQRSFNNQWVPYLGPIPEGAQWLDRNGNIAPQLAANPESDLLIS